MAQGFRNFLKALQVANARDRVVVPDDYLSFFQMLDEPEKRHLSSSGTLPSDQVEMVARRAGVSSAVAERAIDLFQRWRNGPSEAVLEELKVKVMRGTNGEIDVDRPECTSEKTSKGQG